MCATGLALLLYVHADVWVKGVSVGVRSRGVGYVRCVMLLLPKETAHCTVRGSVDARVC